MTQTGSSQRDKDWVADNRASQKWTRLELAGRVVWALVQPLFRFSPRPLWGWRRMLLRLFGAQIGRDVHIFPTARITIPWNLSAADSAAIGDRVIVYALGPIHIGARATISQGAHLCAGTHDWRGPAMTLLKPPITIAEDVWICADAFVGPDVSVGAKAILGARAVVMNDVPTEAIMMGNPAQQVGQRGARS
ncbi:acetyltransferase [Planktotalea sp.]|uniref:acetyltransferase n=1 Tax=Planktotalea sp. TaxID=2029877 RepID=UPI003D6BCC75